MSLRLYKSAISQVFFVLFAGYLGYYMGFVYDLMRHYQDIPAFYIGHEWNEILSDLRVYILGSDFYHITVKYIVSRFTDSRQVFGAVASMIYATAFVFFFRQFKQYYKDRNVIFFNVVMLVCVCTVVEFFWYQGFRYWLGVYVFFGFFLKYLNTRRWWWLLGCLLVLYFHFTLVVLLGCLIINWLLSFTNKYFRLALLGLGLFVRSLNVDFVPLMLQYIPWTNGLSIALTDEKIRSNVLEYIAERRETGNLVYDCRMGFLILFGLGLMFLFRKLKVPFDKHYGKLFFFAMTLFTIANFGYADMTFYTRFTQGSVLAFYCYLYIISVKYKDRLQKYKFSLFLLALIPAIYSISVAFAQVRDYIFHTELIFGNMFMEWDGNALNMEYNW